ncbi:TipAS antibiotic-recognition domain-containing protein [Streptomyces sp. NPDC059446]|uniref:TipAS antibiotic-recognition domain-containing protein n=1 Tax=Streptomyces sp. NPDC059446 TaxID=3346833 RepID=UPI0036A337C9
MQQILLLRELDLGLRWIQAVLDSRLDGVAVLREHHRRLLAGRDRLETLARTVGRTIAELEEARDNWKKPGTTGRWPRSTSRRTFSVHGGRYAGLRPRGAGRGGRRLPADLAVLDLKAAAYRGVGQTCVDDPRMRATFDRTADGLAVHQRDAMTVYADARLR